MTNLEKIKAKVKHPMFKDVDFQSALDDRGLMATDDYVIDNLRAVELTRADLLSIVVSLPNVSENGFSVSVTDKEILKKTASGIYSKYGEIDSSSITVTNASSRW